MIVMGILRYMGISFDEKEDELSNEHEGSIEQNYTV
jgi:hypothetical protein